MTPRFKSEARVLVEGRENIFLRPEAENKLMDRGSVDPETVTSQVQLVLSRDLAREVIKELNLAELPEFNAALNEFSPLSFLRTIGILKDPMSMTLEERVLGSYYDRLQAFALDKSRVISIEFQSADPELAPKIANLIAEKYLTFQQVAKQDQARSAGKWLSGELEKLRDTVSEAEGKVEAFRARSNLYFGSGSVTLSNQQLTDLNTQVSAARAQKADSEARARLIREAVASGQPIESSDIANSELIRRLSEQRVTLRAQLAEQSSTLLPQHPRIREMRAQVNDLDQQIRAEGERMARSLENDARVAGARLETLSGALDQLKRQSASTSDQDVQLRALEREAKAQRDLFESYLAKYREATARDSIAAAPADARIISRAVVSNIPFFPKKMPIVLIATVGTFSLAMAFVVTGALLERREPARRAAADRRHAGAGPDSRTGSGPDARAGRAVQTCAQSHDRQIAGCRQRAAAAATGSRCGNQHRCDRGFAPASGGRRTRHRRHRRRARRRHHAVGHRARPHAGPHVPRGAGRPRVRLAEHRGDLERPGGAGYRRAGARVGFVRRHHHPRQPSRGCIWWPPGRSGTMPRASSFPRCYGQPSARWRKATTIW